jgi:photosystem II stability/assembly factor-like uncharacterized protein
MMTTLALLLFTASAITLPNKAPCSIQRAVATDSNLWLLCDREQVVFSKDNGATWSQSKLPDDTRMRAIHFFDNNHGFLAGDNGTLLATDDAGRNWRKVAVPTTEHLTSLHFVGRQGWITGWGGVVLHSSDGGREWKRQNTQTSQSLEDVYFTDDDHGWAVGWAGAMLRTSNGGETWHKVKSAVMSSLNAVYFRDTLNGWAVGFDGQILRTMDGGQKWEAQVAPLRESLKSVLFDVRGRGWIVADTHLLFSEDSGATWRQTPVTGAIALATVIPAGDEVLAIGQTGLFRVKTSTAADDPARSGS